MDEVFLLLIAGAALLALPVLGVVGFLRGGRARREIARLERRVAVLEAALADLRAGAPRDAAAAATPVAEALASAPPASETPVPAPPVPETPMVAAAPASVPPAMPSLEERIAGRWAVWLGGATIALAAIFLVRYSIEEELLGPAARIGLGLALGLALIAASEGLRRRVGAVPGSGVPGRLAVPPPMIPPALAAAGIVALFATTLASLVVHQLIAPMTAFAALAAISATAMALALLHGPMVALLGQAGAFAVPLLVDTGGGSAFGLFGYVLAVAGGCLALARWRGWRWSAWIALAGGLGWFALWVMLAWKTGDATWVAVFLVALALLHLGPMIAPLADAVPRREPGLTRDRLPDLPLLAIAAAAVVLARISDYATAALVALALLLGLTAIDARRRQRLDHVPGAVALAALLAMLAWHVPQLVEPSWPSQRVVITDVLTPAAWRFLAWTAIYAGIGAIAGAALLWGAVRPWRWAALAALLPTALWVVAYWRVEDFARATPWTAAALALAAALVALAGAIARHRATGGMTLALGVVAIGATAALSLAAATLLQTGWLSIVLSLQLPAIAWIASRLGAGELRWAAGLLAVVVIVRLVLNPAVLGYDVGGWPILNALLYVYGVPALACAMAAVMFARQGGRDWVVLVLEVGALAFATYLVTMEIRHWSGGGRLDGDPGGLQEIALHADAWLAIALAIYARAPLLDNPVLRWGWRLLAALGALGVAVALVANPSWIPDDVGRWPVFNVLGLAYLVPALLAVGFAAIAEARGSRRLAAVAGGSALVLGFIYASLEVARAFRGSQMHVGVPGDGEMYAYSAVWLLYGVGLLVLGLWRGRKALRLAALAVVGLTILKVFLVDMDALTGVLRVLSFLGLGLSLLGLAWIYQRFVLAPAASSPPGSSAA